jgi:Tol biopolymer transport system component/DNA-binding winged helix-turn-helix (wHTH) protein
MASSPTSTGSVCFAGFAVDFRSRQLSRKGTVVRLPDQSFEILVALIEQPGVLVTREELRMRLWPAETFVDFDHGLNNAVKRLRDALGDSAEVPHFIETLPRRGYRFIAQIETTPPPALEQKSPVNDTSVKPVQQPVAPRYFGRAQVIAVSFFLAALAALVWTLLKHPAPPRAIAELKLTSNSSENSVDSAAISPDGKYLAYLDRTGMYLKHIRTGETHIIAAAGGSTAIDGWFPDSTHLLVTREDQSGRPGLWDVSVLGGSLRQLAADGLKGAVSPDGTHIAYFRQDRNADQSWEEWVMRSDGTTPVMVTADKSSYASAPTWSPDGTLIAHIKFEWALFTPTSSVVLTDWKTNSSKILFSDSRLGRSLYWLSDGRLCYSRWDPGNSQYTELWTVRPLDSAPTLSPQLVTSVPGQVLGISGRTDAKSLMVLRGNPNPSIYVGELSSDGSHLRSNKRLTLDESQNFPTAWTPDSKSVLFISDRNGGPQIFKQAIDQPLSENLVSSAELLTEPRLSPDGTEVLYLSVPKTAAPETPSSVFAVPLTGGVPRLILKDVHIWNWQCAKLPSTVCLYSISKGTDSETYRFDVHRGKSSDPPQTDPLGNWTLSPDGSQRAIVTPTPGVIQLRPINGAPSRTLSVKGFGRLGNIDWSADGKSLLVTAGNQHTGTALLKVGLDGKVSVLLHSADLAVGCAVPSPDGRFLAIAQMTGNQNVWQLENF